MKKKTRNKVIVVVALVVVVLIGYFSFFKKDVAEDKTVKVGIMSGSKESTEIWDSVAKTAKDKYNINLKFVRFTDYNQPNTALVNGDVDINAFQHYAFLNEWNEANNADLQAIGDILVSPIRLYSKKHTDVKDIPNKGTIAVPNDTSNESRALYVLESAGLIKLDTKAGALATVKDVTENPKDLTIKELDGSQTASALSSVDAAVVNNDFSVPAGLTNKEVIATEALNENSKQWINIIVARKEDKDNKLYQDVVKAYQTKETEDLFAKLYPEKGTIPAWNLKLK
ncbi:MetQ/NlpA family ABC transporter substrate-binding protein [Lactococcus garvieae]|uniref:MetQ/NlpA family ABC transporter substrate-binding protein n=1 Tax=Lactococcus garvieae TaxID=1363 RepID=UPI0018D9C013|nr:MetQ/NlpA family ABC transporter substrate-binding protein [Lactococcus garvieae]QPS71016.1 MetQ/NlpA family ABC transporter substrate-binding protein [Lactococcus garvieae]